MSDDSKTNAAKDRIEAAKTSAEDAETVDETLKSETDPAQDPAKDEAATDEAVEQIEEPEAQDDVTEPEPAPEENPPPPVEVPAEETGGSLSAVILKYLVILLIGGGAALWAGPRIAPQLPGWAAPVATFLTPGVDKATAEVAAATAAMDEKLAAITARVDEIAGEATAAGEAATSAAALAETKAAETAAAIAAELQEVAAEPRADLSRLNEVAERLATAEATLAGLRTEIDGLAGFSGGDASPSAEMLERVAAFGAAVEGLRTEMAALSSKAVEIEGKADGELVDNLAQRVAALEGGEAATSGARAAASDIRRDAAIDAALTRIGQALVSGASFGEALTSVEDLTGIAPPEGLSAAASGAPTQDTLLRGFPLAAQEAYAAALVSEAGDGMVSTVFARLQGRLGGRPAAETQGDDPGAVLSRVEARLNEGRLAEARAEAGGLSEASQAAMGGWLAALDQAIAAADGLTAYAQALQTN